MFEAAARDCFFALPGWYDLMARYGVPPATETRLYSDERAGSGSALVLQVVEGNGRRRLASLTNAYSVEHGILAAPGADAPSGNRRDFREMLEECPRWDAVALEELDPLAPSYPTPQLRLFAAPGSSSNASSIPGPGSRKPRG